MSDDDWEAQADTKPAVVPAVAAAVGVNAWEGEDEEEQGTVAEAWDADETPKATGPAVPAVVKPKKLAKQKLEKAKEEARKRAEEEEKKRADAMTTEEKYAHKLKLQKEVEEADHKLTEELFGADVVKEDTKNTKKEDTLDMPLKSAADCEKLADLIAEKFKKLGNASFSVAFMKQVISRVTDGMKLDDVNTLKHAITVKHNEARTQEAGKKKKKGKASDTKKFLNTDDDRGGFGPAGDEDSEQFDFI